MPNPIHHMTSFLEAIASRILLFDGAMGTEIQSLNPQPTDFPGNRDGFNDGLILTNPEWIKQIHRSYLKVGADCIETNTFGSNYLKLAEYAFGDNTLEFNKKAAGIAREVCKEPQFRDRPRYVIGSMGPTGYLPSSDDPDPSIQHIEGFSNTIFSFCAHAYVVFFIVLILPIITHPESCQ
ncbi:MAG: homocysteine S-methyltransferase family protein [Candidatus Nitrosopolaris sp.]